MQLIAKLAELLGLASPSSDEADIESYGVGAVMPYEVSSLALSESLRRD